jgi:glycosyltransferase involved in cell wall biosynthesis/SAM-dependent methyltransferase
VRNDEHCNDRAERLPKKVARARVAQRWRFSRREIPSMRIALYVHCFFPTHFYGTEAYTLELARELVALGHEPIVVSATLAGEPGQARLIEEFTYEGIRILSIDKNIYPNRCVRDTYEQPALRQIHERMLRRLQPDVVHVCHLISHTTALLEVTRRMGIPTFATLTDFFGVCYNNVLENAEGELCSGPNARRSNCIACYLKLEGSRQNADLLAKLANLPGVRRVVSRGLASLGQSENRPFVINGFIPNDVIVRPHILRQAMGGYREALAPTLFLKNAYEHNDFPSLIRVSHFGIAIDRGLKPPRSDAKAVRLGFIGQVSPHKGVHLILDALQRCGRGNLSLTIWGSLNQVPEYVKRLRSQARTLPVSFRGTIPRTELADALRSIDYLVIPSTWYENSPLILLQAMATHTPPVIADVPGMTEFVEHGRNGFHFTRGDADSLARILQTVADDPELVSRLSAKTAYGRTPADMAKDVARMYADHDLPWTGASIAFASDAQLVGGDPLDRGLEGAFEDWLHFNAISAFESERNLARVAPFAPIELISETTGLERVEDFASHGVDIVRALAAALDQPLGSFRSWLDFGVGVGRLARMFKAFTGRYVGVDVDLRAILWVRENLPWVRAIHTIPGGRLPFPDSYFDMVASISVFSHLSEPDQTFYLSELHRVTQPGGSLVITVHGERALRRAMEEATVLELLGIGPNHLTLASAALSKGSGLHFVKQNGHLTTDDYEYGITFMSRDWIDSVWSQWYEVLKVVPGGIHDFQDVVVLRRR